MCLEIVRFLAQKVCRRRQDKRDGFAEALRKASEIMPKSILFPIIYILGAVVALCTFFLATVGAAESIIVLVVSSSVAVGLTYGLAKGKRAVRKFCKYYFLIGGIGSVGAASIAVLQGAGPLFGVLVGLNAVLALCCYFSVKSESAVEWCSS